MILLPPRISLISRNPTLSLQTLIRPLSISGHLSSRSPMAPPPPPELVAEYAKSGRSSCKGCGNAIAAGALRLGLSSKDPRGFDNVKWHHLDCFPANTQPIRDAEGVQGFSALKESDQEAIKKLEAAASLIEQSDKLAAAAKENSLGVDFSVSGVKDKYKVLAEYARSGRSSCKSCGEAIAAGSLRLGLSTKDPRGFDFVKWLHLDCFPAQFQLVSASEEIDGFSSLKNCDQEALKKLETGASIEQSDKKVKLQSDKKVHERDDDSGIGNSDQWTSKKAKIHNQVDTESADSEERTKAALQLSGSGEDRGLEIDFSVSDIKEKYKDATLPSNWKAYKTIIFHEREDGLRDSEKIAAFDFDGCLVNTSVKRIGPDAWSLMYPSIPGKLQELFNSGYKLVIFTNESNIERWKNKRQQAVDSKIGRLDNFIKQVKVPIQVFIACGIGKNKDQMEDFFRKPNPGMWRLMEGHFNSGIAINMDQSFYVGDAAGRINDHSDADSKFAQAVGLKFHLPEEFFSA